MIDRLFMWLFGKFAHRLGSVDEPWYGLLNGLANRIRLLIHPERAVRFGSLHPDKTIYLIRDLPPDTGLASWHDRVIGYLMRAHRKGWIPVIDPPPPAQKDSGTWYDYFKPVSDVPLTEAMNAQHVVVATTQAAIYKRFNWKNVRKRHALCGNIQLSDALQAYVDKTLARIRENMPRPIVGVRFRGTDYRSGGAWCPVGHAKVPDVDVFCRQVEADCRAWGVPIGQGEHLFLMTEEKEAFESIVKRYPKCRFVDKELFADYGFKTCLCYLRLPHTTPLMNNYHYMAEIMMLKECDYLVGGYNGGVLVALNLNGGTYKGVDIFKTGVN